MKENHYDDAVFFAKYSGMDRSIRGLSAAGEWHVLKSMLPPVQGRRILDLGCGFGWHCQYAADQGAAKVVGTDLSDNMLQKARAQTSPAIEYHQLAIEDTDFGPESFDVVLSSLAMHYVADFGEVCRKIYRMLAKGGQFLFSAEHPVFTAQGSQQWFPSDQHRTHWPVDRYFYEGVRDAVFLGEKITKYHRTLQSYTSALFDAGFALTDLREPMPAQEAVDAIAGMRDELRRPMMLILSAQKP